MELKMNDKIGMANKKCPYVVRFEEIELEKACEIMRKNDGYFDADSRTLVVFSEDLNINITKVESEDKSIISEVREESKKLGKKEGKWAGDTEGFERGYSKGLADMRELKEIGGE